MNMRRLAVGAVVLVLILFGIALAVPDSRLMMRGLIGRENFYAGKPTSYWRQALREENAKEDHSTQPVAAALLHGSPDVIPVLTDLLQDEDPGVRATAANLLPTHFMADPGPEAKAAVGPLTAALKDRDKVVRARAAEALSCIGPAAREAVPDLMNLLTDPDPVVAFHATRALAEIGPEARAAVPALLRACSDSRMPVREGAKRAVKAIDADAAERAGIPPGDNPPRPVPPTNERRR